MIDMAKIDPSIILDWESLEGRSKTQDEINQERLQAWQKKYEAHVSLSNWRKYNTASKVHSND